jgi:hypothetical protein
VPGNCYGRWYAADNVAIALRTADKLIFKLCLERVSILEPPFKPVIVVAVKVVDDHVFNRGARDGNRTRTLKEREILSLLCLPISPPGLGVSIISVADMKKGKATSAFPFLFGAAEESRTLDLYLGKVSLYQLSYCRKIWRREPESNRPTRICNPVHNRFAIAPCLHSALLRWNWLAKPIPEKLERQKSLELSTYTLARYRSTN